MYSYQIGDFEVSINRLYLSRKDVGNIYSVTFGVRVISCGFLNMQFCFRIL